jgi:hypothetical protein
MKLPVFKAIGATFAFVVQNWLDIVKIVWVPLVLMFGAYWLVMPGYVSAGSAMQSYTPDQPEFGAAASNFAVQALIFTGVVMLFSLILAAGLLKLVIRGERPSAPFWLGFGADELRLLGTTLAVMLVNIGIVLAIAVLVFLANMLSSLGPGPGGFIMFIAIIIGVIAAVWANLKFSVASAATIDRKKIAVVDSFLTTDENVGNLLGYWLLFIAMALVLQLVTGPLLTPPGYVDAIREAMTSGSMRDQQAAVKRANELMLDMYRFKDIGGTIRFVASTLLTGVTLTVTAIAGGVAWRYLTGAERGETTEPEQPPSA